MTDTALSPRATVRGIDQLDIDIVQRLRADPLVANADLARDFGVSNATIGTRLGRLKDLRMARVVGVTPVRAAGYGAIGRLMIRLAPRAVAHQESVAAAFARIPGVISIASQLHEEQLTLCVITEDLDRLDRIVLHDMAKVEGVEAIRVALLTSFHKERTDIGYRKEAPPTAQQRYDYLKGTLLGDRLGDVELRLLSEYQADGRLSAREAARRLDISEPSARSRIRHLRESGVLTFVTEVHPATFGFNRAAAIRVDAEPSLLPSLIERLVGRDEVSMATMCLGDEYPLALLIHATAPAAFVQHVLYSQPGVRGVRVIDQVRSFVHDTNWMLGSPPRPLAGDAPE